MADYTIRIEATTEEAEKKLKRVDDRVVKLEKGASINLTVPSAGQVLGTLGDITKTLGTVAKQAIAVSKAANIGPGAVLNDLEDVFGLVKKSGEKGISLMQALSKATPTNILGNTFNAAADGAVSLAKQISNVGYEVFGLTQSVNILRQSFGGFFDDTIGREIRLQEALLRTRTTLVSNSKVLKNGQELTDPYQALVALEKPIDEVLTNIRRRSLDIAGTTSDAIVQVFGVVASQVGAFGGTLKDAEDLAITFAGALGTIGMSDPMLANQEIRSILTGNIDQNSVLARSLGITNADIQKAKQSTEGLVAWLTKRLEGFTAGQKLAAQGFAGITSNIEEVRQEASRTFGKPMLQPLLEGLTAVYKRLQLVFDQILGISDGLGRIGSTVFSGLIGSVAAAPVLQNFDERKQIETFKATEGAIAQAAVKVQAAIDKVRPLIANLASEVIKAFTTIGSGLVNLAQGFAAFKFEQLSLQINSMLGLAKILNSTLVPTLKVVLDLYGQILALPLFQALTQINAQLQLLERLGVLPLSRIILYFNGFWESIKTAIGWVQAFGQFVVKTVNIIVNAVASSISGISSSLTLIGSKITEITELVVTRIIAVVRIVAREVSTFLLGLAIKIRLLEPQLGVLADVVAGIGRAFGNIDKAAAQTKAAVQQFSVQAQSALQNVAVAGERAAVATRNLGTTIGNFLRPRLMELGKNLLEMGKNLIKFQILLFLVEKGLGLLTYAWTQYTKAQQEASDQTKAEMALKRLSTAYKDLGENASAAAKALRDAEQAVLNERRNKLRTDIPELLPKVTEAGKRADAAAAKARARQQELDRIREAERKLGAKTATLSIAPAYDADFVRAQREAIRLRTEYISKSRELQKIEEVLAQQDQNQKDVENVQIMVRERKDIEEAIKELRKQSEVELREERFRTAREVASLEQTLREAARKAERSELERRLAQESQGLIGVRAGIAKILGDYERGLFDAQTEAQRRQFEIAEQRQNLEKALADYKIKTEEQTAKLRKRVGEYNVKIDDYLTTQQKRRDAERLETEMKIAALRTDEFLLTPKEKEVFQNTAAKAGVSATGLLALLRMFPSNLQALGSPVGRMTSVDALLPWMQSAKASLPVLGKGQQAIIDALGKSEEANGFGQGTGRVFYNRAAKDLETNLFFVPKPAVPGKLEPFRDLQNEFNSGASERRRMGEQILALRQRVKATLNIQDLFNNKNQVIDSLASQTYTEVPTPQAARDQLEANRTQFMLLTTAFQNGLRQVDPLMSALAELKLAASNAADQFVTSLRSMRDASGKLLYSNQSMTDMSDQLQELFNTIDQLDVNRLRSNLKQYEKYLEEARTNTTPGSVNTAPLIVSVLREALRIREAMPTVQATQAQQMLNQFQQELLGLPEQLRQEKQRLKDDYSAAITPSNPLQARLFQAEIQIREKRLELDKRNTLQTEQGQQYITQFSEKLRTSAFELGTFEQRIKNALEHVAFIRDVADTYTQGIKSVVNSVLTSGDINEAVNNMMDSLRDKITSYILDIATKPMRDALEQSLMKFLKVPSAEELANQQRDAARDTAMAASLDLDGKRNDLLQRLVTNTQNNDTATLSTNATTNQPATNLNSEAQKAANNLRGISSTTTSLPQSFSTLQRTLSGVTGVISSVAMGIAGVNQLGKGGVQNTLMGLASIFGSVATVTGMFGKGGALTGLFSKSSVPARASGGPVMSRRPYLVGERGPELFMPQSSGMVIPNNRTEALLASRGALASPPSSGDPDINPFDTSREALGDAAPFNANREAIATVAAVTRERQTDRALTLALTAPPKPMDVRYESRVINSTEYVSAEQFRQGLRDAAERGRAMTLSSLRNSVKTRRSVGM